MVDFIGGWSQKTEIALCTLVLWLGIALSKFYTWRTRYGQANEHNASVPRDHWLEEWEQREKGAVVRHIEARVPSAQRAPFAGGGPAPGGPVRRALQHSSFTLRHRLCHPGRLDFRTLHQDVSMEQVLKHLGYFDALRGFGPQRRGPCPLHDSPQVPHRSFSVNLAKGVFRCFHPPCQAQGNTLDLWAAVQQLPIHEAAHQFAETFHRHPHLDIRDKSSIREEEPVTRNPSTR